MYFDIIYIYFYISKFFKYYINFKKCYIGNFYRTAKKFILIADTSFY